MNQKVETPRNSHVKRNLTIVVILLVIIGVSATVVYGLAFGLSGCFGGCGINKSVRVSGIPACTSMNASCRINLVNTGTVDVNADSCWFNYGVVVQGNSSTASTSGLLGGRGYLMSAPGKLAASITVPVGSSITVYCIEGGEATSNLKGTPTRGTIGFEPTEQVQNADFSSNWQ
ncbi:MAG TPA: hypothetical protein VGR53_03980 [Nitrososphaerales archaeon]|nr:hypothetical protein [Nitrososphaerales archaeon]